ncbi:MAG: GNAT family N-acetyltransferase [Aquisalimonadaceae bacterium]
MSKIQFKSPDISHAEQIAKMVRESEKLDSNSDYYYAIWCTDFSRHSAVALKDNEVIAFVTGYRRPTAPETYFLWQTATKPRHGVPNLGVDLIQFAAEKEIERGANAIEASVDAQNTPIIILMKTLCRRLGGKIKTSVLFSSEVLSATGADHHDETLYRIDLASSSMSAA